MCKSMGRPVVRVPFAACPLVILFVVCAAWIAPAHAATVKPDRSFEIIKQAVHSDVSKRCVTFDLTFSRPPDFFSVDKFGRPANSFQYEIKPSANWESPGDSQVETVIRGDEIRVAHKVRVRTALGDPDPDPVSGGWGDVRGAVPYSLHGNSLSFDVGFDVLKETDGVFAYSLFTTEFGQTRSLVDAVAIPLPAAVWTGAGGLVLAALSMRMLRRAF